MLVEDDVLAAQAIGDLFESLQLPFTIASDARAALGLSGKACMAACDVPLPGQTSGLEHWPLNCKKGWQCHTC